MFVDLPYNDYLEHYGPEYTLHITPSNMENQNSREYLEKIKYATCLPALCLLLLEIQFYGG